MGPRLHQGKTQIFPCGLASHFYEQPVFLTENDTVKILIFTFVQTLFSCLHFQIQLLYYIDEQRRRSTRRLAFLLQLSLPRRMYTVHVATVDFGSDLGEPLSGRKTSRKKSSSRRNGMRTSECSGHLYCRCRSYCVPT